VKSFDSCEASNGSATPSTIKALKWQQKSPDPADLILQFCHSRNSAYQGLSATKVALSDDCLPRGLMQDARLKGLVEITKMATLLLASVD